MKRTTLQARIKNPAFAHQTTSTFRHVSISGHVFFVTFHVKPSSNMRIPDLSYQLRRFALAHGFEFMCSV